MIDWDRLEEENSKDVGVLQNMNYEFCWFENNYG